MSRDPQTYGTIRQKYDEWITLERNRPEREHLRRTETYLPPPREGNPDMSRTIATVIGVGIGVMLLALAMYAFRTASFWADAGRDGAQVGYILIGVFLLIAGGGGIAATINHNFRVLAGTQHH